MKTLSIKADESERVTVAKTFNIPVDFPFDISDKTFEIRYNESMFSESAAYDFYASHGGRGISAGNYYSSSASTLSNSKPGISRTSELFNTYYIYTFDGKLLAEYDHNGNCVRDFIYFGDRLIAEYRPQTDKYYYYMTDQVNSTRIITDENGNVVFSEAYGPYGDIQKTWVNNYDPKLKFSGKEREAYSGLDYFGARYYDHKSYRFNSVDPLINRKEALFNPQLLNLYAYCRNNPITFKDPDGREIGPAPVDALEDYYIRKYAGPQFEGKNIKQRNQIRLYISKAILAYLIAHGLLSPDPPENKSISDDYPENPDDLELQDGWHETEAKDKTGGRHRIWRGPNDEEIRWDKEGRRGSQKERGSHYHDSRFPGKHIKPGTKKKDLEKKHGG